ncbi:MAG: hypothetical protein B6D64_04670 [Bacteroidetes bacterium 4484_276]|nr:MAG: hypothetical protein B6D64_04670 [Bacteroidetes bacterium 4484_276]OYT13991.1 MAG: hypothetical protein B6I19_02175 [Bacteroidetes bacterium 4572_114]
MKNYILIFGVVSYFLLIFAGCNKDDTQELKDLTLLDYKKLNIPETSGLSFNKQENTFLTVSDNSDRVYIISTDGEVLDSLIYDGQNLEGVVYDANSFRIFVVEEQTNEVIQLDTIGNETGRFTIDLNNTEPNHGIEGITFNPLNGHLYVVSEKSPAILFELTTDGEIVAQHQLGFMEDYSSVYFDGPGNSLWILSDQSELLVRCDLSGQPLEWFSTGLKDAEGVVVDSANSKVWIITDSGNTLYSFSF